MNLLFDLGNVIIDIDIPRAQKAISRLLRDPGKFEPVTEIILKYETGRIRTDLFINQILALAHRDVQALDVIEAWNSMLLGIPPRRLTMLSELRPKHRVFLLSNTNELHLTWVHRYVSIEHSVSDFEGTFFDQAFYSHILKDRKPNASIFLRAAATAGIEPAHTLFMDDMPQNIAAAAAVGYQTYQVTPETDIADYLRASGIW